VAQRRYVTVIQSPDGVIAVPIAPCPSGIYACRRTPAARVPSCGCGTDAAASGEASGCAGRHKLSHSAHCIRWLNPAATRSPCGCWAAWGGGGADFPTEKVRRFPEVISRVSVSAWAGCSRPRFPGGQRIPKSLRQPGPNVSIEYYRQLAASSSGIKMQCSTTRWFPRSYPRSPSHAHVSSHQLPVEIANSTVVHQHT